MFSVDSDHRRRISPQVPCIRIGQAVEIEAAIGFDCKNAPLGGGLNQAPDQLHHSLAPLDVEVIRGRAEDQPRLGPQAVAVASPEECVGVDDAHNLTRAERFHACAGGRGPWAGAAR